MEGKEGEGGKVQIGSFQGLGDHAEGRRSWFRATTRSTEGLGPGLSAWYQGTGGRDPPWECAGPHSSQDLLGDPAWMQNPSGSPRTAFVG